MKEWKDENPWFVFCSFIASHHPFEAPIDQINRYDERDIPLPEEKGGVEGCLVPEPARSAIGETKKYSSKIQRRIVHYYFASISLIDDCVGLLVKTLKDTRIYDDTLILFTSDHGEFLGNHGLLRKPSIHCDELLKVPLMMKLPGSRCAGTRIDGLIELVDVYPTLAGFLRIDVNPGVQGINWADKIGKGENIGRDEIYAEMHEVKPIFTSLVGPYTAVVSLRSKQWKLNLYPAAGIEYGQLFNLQEDPDEARNLYADNSFRAVKEERLWRLIRRTHFMADPVPLWLSQY
ncbi:MAG: sulfatase-like hydrolase/transferase [Candidatus Omnitrophica bacterium]|nr:sulfatase-like hydrolase/transferase [Candidatus Omnitrophota bacterium]